MMFDIFFSICQTEVDGVLPSEATMFQNFFSQVTLADQLGFGTAWIAEAHLSCEVQKTHKNPVIPNFKGEIGLNTDILQLAPHIWQRTKSIHVGSAIRNILCNGGPIAHGEAVRMFLALHAISPYRERQLHLGFASGRFPFSNEPYGIVPRDLVEELSFPVQRGFIFKEATEIFLRILRGDVFSSDDTESYAMTRHSFRAPQDFDEIIARIGLPATTQSIPVRKRWSFQRLQVIPKEVSLTPLKLIIGSHDPDTQALANRILPCGVFNLSITPDHVIEETHQRMSDVYFTKGSWSRALMPRTTLCFINDDPVPEAEKNQRAKLKAEKAVLNYWRAMEHTIDPAKIATAVENALYGSPEVITKKLREKFHPEDRLMLWFDFNNHNNEDVCRSMTLFMDKVGRGFS